MPSISQSKVKFTMFMMEFTIFEVSGTDLELNFNLGQFSPSKTSLELHSCEDDTKACSQRYSSKTFFIK